MPSAPLTLDDRYIAMAPLIICPGGIYVIRNLVNGKVYVGSAVHILQRWRQHRYDLSRKGHHSRYLQKAWGKHGASAFSWEVLERVVNKSDLLFREQFWIDHLSAYDPAYGYNMVSRAANNLGLKLSPETRKLISAANLGRLRGPPSKEHRDNLSKALKGRKHGPLSPERAASYIARIRSDVAIERQRAAMAKKTGKPLNPVHAENVRHVLIARNKASRGRTRRGAVQLDLFL